jgi:catechol 2,3-dioxygenase-like lactoylglutathione lyase family enzyme
MSVKFYSSVIFVKNISLSKEFYTNIMNQEVEFDFGANIIFKSKLSLWQLISGHEIKSIAGSPDSGNRFELYFESEDLKKDIEKIKCAGVKFLHDIKTEPWGQQTIRFFDPDNHLIELGETLNIFVSRIFKETGSASVTAKITGVEPEIIRSIIKG